MDLTVVLDEKKLNVRATAVIIHDNKLLVHKKENENFCALVGGRVKIGESSAKTIKREIFEEMGKRIEIKEYLTTIENFFEGEDMPYHEIMFVYRAEFEDEADKKITETIKNIEGEDDLSYQWMDLDKIDEINLKPPALKDMLKNNIFPAHKIHDERIQKYYKNTEGKEPHENLQRFLNMKINPGKAIDIGCGAGRDTIALIKNGWTVTAIDGRNTEQMISKSLTEDELKRFNFERQEFENLKLEKSNLVVANFSLPFCNKNYFNEAWNRIKNSILQDGYFVGNFFGKRDEWKKTKPNLIYFSKDEVLNLFNDFDIISFEEIERDGITGEGKQKYWHLFNVMAKKK